jgi:carboxyl-terminal processing protease
MIPDRTLNEAQLSTSLSADQRKKVLDRVLAALQKRFYAPEKLNGDWHAAVERHRPSIESANSPADFEKEVSGLLKGLSFGLRRKDGNRR